MIKPMSASFRFVAASCCLIGLVGCADLSPTEQRVLSGGSLGSAIGIGVTVLTGGCIPCGGSIGSLLGSGAGYLYDDYMDGKPNKDSP